MTARFAVIGNPVSHSLSPRIHALFAEAAGIDLCYEALSAPVDDFAATAERFFAAGGAGLNVTVPFKERAFEWVASAGPHATDARAVNTIMRRGEALHGCNTDGIGLVRDLTEQLGVTLARSRILLLGAGGAVSGVLRPLLEREPARLVVANRTPQKARALRARVADPRLEAVALDGLEADYDLVINGTAASLSGEVPALPPEAVRGSLCYDMSYAKESTAFCRWALAHGAAAAVDGLGMLIEQAAEAFRLWHGVLPATRPVRDRLRAEAQRS